MQSDLTERVFCTPGNGGTGGMARNIGIAADDVVALAKFARSERIGLAVLGPEAAVAAGVGDALRDLDIPVFGPGRDAGRIETSKAFAKRLMAVAGVPTPEFAVFTDAPAAKRWARERDGRVAVKADGLALGKGVVVASEPAEAEAAIDEMLVAKAFGQAGATVVLEERLAGPELSVLALTDGTEVVPLAPARDFKRAREGDEGPNTGGMGAYSPPIGVDRRLLDEVTAEVLKPVIQQLAADGCEYRGVLYAGLMLTEGGPQVLEFNARFGDPEAQVVLPRLESDLVALMLAAARGGLGSTPDLRWKSDATVGIVVASAGYPDDYVTGHQISGLTQMPAGVIVFHAGTRFEPGRGLVTAGGRVLTVVGSGPSVEAARENALAGAGRVRFSGAYFRSDIALEAI
jgi:phosphoribosylamine---glycine ligase